MKIDPHMYGSIQTMSYTVAEMMVNNDRVGFKVNDHEFSLPKIVIENEFVTAGVEHFNDIYDFVIDSEIDPETFIKELAKYLSCGDFSFDEKNKMYMCYSLNISPALSEFIDKYLKRRINLLEWICYTYDKKLKNELYQLKESFYWERWDMIHDENADKIIDVIKTEFPDIWGRLMRNYSDTKDHIKPMFTLKNEEKYSASCFLSFRVYSTEEEMFFPRFVKSYLAKHNIELKHVVPNIDYDDLWKVFMQTYPTASCAEEKGIYHKQYSLRQVCFVNLPSGGFRKVYRKTIANGHIDTAWSSDDDDDAECESDTNSEYNGYFFVTKIDAQQKRTYIRQ